MKRIIIVALACVVGATFHSAKAQQLQSRVDSLSYSFGLAQSQGLVRFLQQFNQDIFGDSEKGLDIDLFLSGLNTGVKKEQALMTPEDANNMLDTLIKVVKSEQMMKLYGENKKAGEDFLAENAEKKDVKTLESGVQYKILQEGNGEIPTATQKVKVHYEGRLLNDTVFDSSYKRGKPAEFRGDQVIKGWTEALTHMPVGSIWEIYIPQELAYGERKQGEIIPFSMLIFKIELLEILDK